MGGSIPTPVVIAHAVDVIEMSPIGLPRHTSCV
jgi:hypothetical protein